MQVKQTANVQYFIDKQHIVTTQMTSELWYSTTQSKALDLSLCDVTIYNCEIIDMPSKHF